MKSMNNDTTILVINWCEFNSDMNYTILDNEMEEMTILNAIREYTHCALTALTAIDIERDNDNRFTSG